MVINMKQNREKGSVLKVIWYLLLFIIVVAAGVVAIKYAPHLKLFLTSEETIVKLEKMIDSFGAWGIVILLLLQIVQVLDVYKRQGHNRDDPLPKHQSLYQSHE